LSGWTITQTLSAVRKRTQHKGCKMTIKVA